ncbi:MAG: DUF4258 domain-containing protein [Planctomycetes bacterium]|nr:DUF4258 domain-containing protein [Planctomycetota bacterium]
MKGDSATARDSMQLSFAWHALIRMRERDISEEDIRSVLERPQIEFPDPDIPGRTVAIREVGSRRIKVHFIRQGDGVLVITVYPVEKRP